MAVQKDRTVAVMVFESAMHEFLSAHLGSGDRQDRATASRGSRPYSGSAKTISSLPAFGRLTSGVIAM